MRRVWSIAKRELSAYFVSPIPYVMGAAMLAVFGYAFSSFLLVTRQASLRPVFGGRALLVLVFVLPVLSVRLVAEEQRNGTLELLLTSPVREGEIILGKFLAGLILYMLLLLPTAYYPLVLEIVGSPDWGAVLTAYLGMLFLGGALLGLGTLASTLARGPIAAALLGTALALCLWFLPAAATFIHEPSALILRYAGLSEHIADFAKGVVDTRHVVYYLGVTAASLFAAARILEARRSRPCRDA